MIWILSIAVLIIVGVLAYKAKNKKGMTVQAPFEVKSSKGESLLKVEETKPEVVSTTITKESVENFQSSPSNVVEDTPPVVTKVKKTTSKKSTSTTKRGRKPSTK